MESNNNRNTLMLLLLLGAVLAIFYIFNNKGGDTSLLGSGDEQAAIGGEAVQLLNSVQNIKFDFSVIKSPEFANLKDITAPISNFPVGRPNPFAPVK